ncbi:MAG: hypothetical protein OEM41_08550 [Ignavibacteria bacterium]|nr:hypothetical protein [Ignavibacteria bacterium]
MRYLKYLALLALATIPLLIVKREFDQQSVSHDADDIFEYELTTD